MNAAVSLKERVLAAAAAQPSPTRRKGARRGWMLLGLSVVAGIALLEVAGGVAHSRDRPLSETVRLADGWALASAALTWLTLRRRAMSSTDPRLLVAATLATPVVLYAWIGRFVGPLPEPIGPPDWPCFAFTMAAAATPLASFLYGFRGIEPDRPEILGAAAGAASGAWGGVLALLWCPLTNPWHALIGHAAPITVMTVIGSVLGARSLGLAAPALVGVRASSAPRSAASWR